MQIHLNNSVGRVQIRFSVSIYEEATETPNNTW